MTDTYFPGWEAFVDGVRTPILIADHAFRGVVLDPGSHVVIFEYRPWTFRVGFLVSCVAALVALGMLISGARRRRPSTT